MSAEVLREAASLMRERAVAAEASGDGEPWFPMSELHGLIGGGSRNTADATHIASWRPAVALAVADLLDNEAERVERCEWSVTFGGGPMFPPGIDHVAVARAYLGESA